METQYTLLTIKSHIFKTVFNGQNDLAQKHDNELRNKRMKLFNGIG